MNNENGTTLMKKVITEDLRDAKAQIARMQGALNWYAEMAKTMQRATLHRGQPSRVAHPEGNGTRRRQEGTRGP